MSTRSQLRFVQWIDYENEDDETESTQWIAQVYRDSDGYLESVLPSLTRLKALQDETGTESDPANMAANYILLNKLQGMNLYVGRKSGFGCSLGADDVMAAIQDNDVSGIVALEQPHSC